MVKEAATAVPNGTIPRKASEAGPSPLAQETKARIETCSGPPWRCWLLVVVPNMVMKLLRNGPAERRSLPPSLPTHKPYIKVRHAARVKATTERIELKFKSLRAEKMAIEAEINQAPTGYGLLKELQEVDDQIARGNIKLADEVEMKLTDDEKTAHSSTWRTHRETTESLKKSGVKSTLCYLASAIKCWLTSRSKTLIG